MYEIIQEPANIKHLPSVPLNAELLESIKKYGFVAPFLTMDTWYPICGSQRMRCALELSEQDQKNTLVDVLKLDNSVWFPFYFWGDKEEGHRCSQIMIQQLELVFKSYYMPSEDIGGIKPTYFEEIGDKMHWEARDGKKK